MDRRNKRKCRSCGKHIEAGAMPWVKVTLTGEEMHWHPGCHKEK